jgi:hypothetical protein
MIERQATVRRRADFGLLMRQGKIKEMLAKTLLTETGAPVPVLSCEGRSTGEHVVHERPEGPPVHGLVINMNKHLVKAVLYQKLIKIISCPHNSQGDEYCQMVLFERRTSKGEERKREKVKTR